MIEAILILSGSGWLFFKYLRTKSSRTLLCALLLILLQLSWWPLFLDKTIILSIISFLGFGSVIYFNWIKKKDENAYIYALLFLIFGLYFIGNAIIN